MNNYTTILCKCMGRLPVTANYDGDFCDIDTHVYRELNLDHQVIVHIYIVSMFTVHITSKHYGLLTSGLVC